MSTQSMDEVFAVIDAKIAEHVAAMEDHGRQIEALESAKKALGTTNAASAKQDVKAEAKPTRRRRTKSNGEEEQVLMVTGKQLYWLDQMGYDGDNPQALTRRDASAILKELFAAAEIEDDEAEDAQDEVEEEVKPTRASRTRRSKRNGNGNGNGASTKPTVKSSAKSTNDTKKAAILALDAKGLKPREIADKLDINVSYVYLVKRDTKAAAKK